MLKNGDRGPAVRILQEKLKGLGFDPVEVDGIYGPITRWAVINLQASFGYTVDGMVGRGTARLIDAQLGYDWKRGTMRSDERALEAQGLLSRNPHRDW